ncbi:hypothetical protein EV356DRAFT_532262 [Viridothelium virens]|uniref:Uncharacterized protein n=1 Tax=Viridothelium virens TaxID=1048519 RepID=A0A6A6HAZ2_VIRVR|nr:hypothetical protein EV356DRAFT_532262 [Viridothelium virens]
MTANPSNAAPVDPSLAAAAQIPLQTFTLPTFPPEAQNLKSLTLTSDIALNAYHSLLSDSTFSPETAIPPLPRCIESLTLELFSLGYPPGWLTQLSRRLPNTKDLVVYSQLLGGITAESQADAERFFENLRGLRGLHLLDVFAKPGFYGAIGDILWAERDTEQQAGELGVRKRLLFLEVNFTFQPRQKEFLGTLPGKELHRLVTPSLVTCAFNVSPADVTNDPQDPTNLTEEGEELASGKEEGVRTLEGNLAEKLVEALVKDESRPRGLKVLNTTLYILTVTQFGKLLEAHQGLLMVSASIKEDGSAEKWKKDVRDAALHCPELEQIEVVVVPETQDASAEHLKSTSINLVSSWKREDIVELQEKCPKLTGVKVNLLRMQSAGVTDWIKEEDGSWTSQPEGTVKSK